MAYKSIFITIFVILSSIIPSAADSRTFLSVIKDNQAVISILVDNFTTIDFKEGTVTVNYDSKAFEISKDEVTSFQYTALPVSSINSVGTDKGIIITEDGIVIEQPMMFPLYIYNIRGIEIKRLYQQDNKTIRFSELPNELLIIIYGSQCFKVKGSSK